MENSKPEQDNKINQLKINNENQDNFSPKQETSLLTKRKKFSQNENNHENLQANNLQQDSFDQIQQAETDQIEKRIKLETRETEQTNNQQNLNSVKNVDDNQDIEQQNNLKKFEKIKNNQSQEFQNNQYQLYKNTKENINQNQDDSSKNKEAHNNLQNNNDTGDGDADNKNLIINKKEELLNNKLQEGGEDYNLDDKFKNLEALLQFKQKKNEEKLNEDCVLYIVHPSFDKEIWQQVKKYIESYNLIYKSIDFQEQNKFVVVKFDTQEDQEAFRDHQIQIRLQLGMTDLFFLDEKPENTEKQMKQLNQVAESKIEKSQEKQTENQQQQLFSILIPGQNNDSQAQKIQATPQFTIPVPSIDQNQEKPKLSLIPIPGSTQSYKHFQYQPPQPQPQPQIQQQEQVQPQQQVQHDQYYDQDYSTYYQQSTQQYQSQQQQNQQNQYDQQQFQQMNQFPYQQQQQQQYSPYQQSQPYDQNSYNQQNNQYYNQQQQQSQQSQPQEPQQNNQIISQYTLMRDTTKRIVPEANIFIKNLSLNCNAQDLEQAFSIYGPIVSIKIGVDALGNHQGYGYLQFESLQAAENAIQCANNCTFMEQQIQVQPFNSKLRIDPRNNLYVKNLPPYFSDDQLKLKLEDIFGLYGRITSSVVKMDMQLRKPYAFICFENHLYADLAFKALHDTDPLRCGSRLYISWAEKKGDRSKRLTEMHNTYQGFINPIQLQGYGNNLQNGGGGMMQQNNYQFQYN